MVDYIYLDERKNFGSIAISTKVLVQLVTKALDNIEGVSLKEKLLSKRLSWRLANKVKVSYKNGIAHIKVNIELAKGKDIQQVTSSIQEEITNLLVVAIGHIPFDIAVKVEKII